MNEQQVQEARQAGAVEQLQAIEANVLAAFPYLKDGYRGQPLALVDLLIRYIKKVDGK